MAITKLISIGVMFAIALVPAIAAWWILRRQSLAQLARSRVGRNVAQRFSSLSSGRSPIPDDPEAIYIPGVGFVIGDISCQFNGRSPFIRCAVNPTGPCAECRFYQERPPSTLSSMTQ